MKHRIRLAIAIAALTAGCSTTRTATVGTDPPTTVPATSTAAPATSSTTVDEQGNYYEFHIESTTLQPGDRPAISGKCLYRGRPADIWSVSIATAAAGSTEFPYTFFQAGPPAADGSFLWRITVPPEAPGGSYRAKLSCSAGDVGFGDTYTDVTVAPVSPLGSGRFELVAPSGPKGTPLRVTGACTGDTAHPATEVYVSAVNITSPDAESARFPLAADGTFTVSMPLLYHTGQLDITLACLTGDHVLNRLIRHRTYTVTTESATAPTPSLPTTP